MMTMCRKRPLLGTMLLVLTGWVTVTVAQTDAPPQAPNRPDSDPLAARQQIARDRLIQLEDRMYRLAEKLAETEPEQAKRLEQALRGSREMLIRHHMDEIIELLDKGDLTTAADKESVVSKSIEQLLAILLAEADRTRELQQELERLRAYDKQLQELIERQRELKDRADPSPAPADMKAAGEQRDLKNDTGRLARKMQSGRSPDEQNGGADKETESGSRPADPGGRSTSKPDDRANENDRTQDHSGKKQPEAEPAPGTKNVRQAAQRMQDAAEKLDAQQAGQARGDQQKAIDELEKARIELADKLDQLRREQQVEILRGLESRFRAMLVRQETANRQTSDLEAKGASAWTHADEIALAGLVREEKGLADEAGEALHILREEGTTIVFPQVVEELRDDLQEAASRLQDRQTGPATARLQADIVDLLKELIEAVQQMRDQLQAGDGPPPAGMDQVPPLLPGSAELKMLRSCQTRVNRLTREVQPDNPAGARRLAERQKEVAEMARKMNERITGQ
ncbi:MAG TPA: hypothetical protein VLM89_16785 [Phycisphaerae bacterium]|nr:hypothetical protein [Phycisphaerae bacterium]